MPDEGPIVERIRAALRGHLRVVAEQLDIATVFTREWRYLEGERREAFVAERRRYEERFRALFREGRERGELRTDLDDGTAALLALSAVNWAYTWLRPGAAPTSSPTVSRRSCSTACAATRRAELAESPAGHLAPCSRRLVVNPFATRVTEERLEEVRGGARARRRARRRADGASGPCDRARRRARAAAAPTRSSSSPATAASTRR